MLVSMTGYGSHMADSKEFSVKAEIKSVNSKSFDAKVRVPQQMNDKETEVLSYLEKVLERGKIDLTVGLTYKNPAKLKKSLNKALLEAYLSDIKAISERTGIAADHAITALLSFPDIFQPPDIENEDSEAEWQSVMECIVKATEKLVEHRNEEGRRLQKEIMAYLVEIEEKAKIIAGQKDERLKLVEYKLRNKLEEVNSACFDRNRLEQEMIYYIEKLDITEELDRLFIHLDYFRKTVNDENPGRKLGFIVQEIGREINTIGSKANDSFIQHEVVVMKDNLEKIKQQLANIL